MGIVYYENRNSYIITFRRSNVKLRGCRSKLEDAQALFEEFKIKLQDKDMCIGRYKNLKNFSEKISRIQKDRSKKKEINVLEINGCTIMKAKEGERCRNYWICSSYDDCLDVIAKTTVWPGWKEKV
jgi:hypothetical protein